MPHVTIAHQQETIYGESNDTIPFNLERLERSKSRSVRFQSLISGKGAWLGPMLVLTINRKPYIASPMALSNLTLTYLERSKSRSLRFSVVGYLYDEIDIFASSNITTIWMSKKGVCWRGFPLSQRSFLFFVFQLLSSGVAFLW